MGTLPKMLSSEAQTMKSQVEELTREEVLAAGQLRQGRTPSMRAMVTGTALIEVLRPRRSKALPKAFTLAVTPTRAVAFGCVGVSEDDDGSNYHVVVRSKERGSWPRESVALEGLSGEQGELAPGLEGSLCHHVFAENGGRRESTVVVTSVPEGVAFAPALVCRDREELGAGNPAQLPNERWERTELESEVFNHRYRLLTLRGQDPLYVREIFSPSLIAWLAHDVPAGFSFRTKCGELMTETREAADAAVDEAVPATPNPVG